MWATARVVVAKAEKFGAKVRIAKGAVAHLISGADGKFGAKVEGSGHKTGGQRTGHRTGHRTKFFVIF